MPIPTVSQSLAAAQADVQKLPFEPEMPFRLFRELLQKPLSDNGFTVMQAHEVISQEHEQWFVSIMTALFHKDIENGSKPWTTTKLHMPIEMPRLPHSEDDFIPDWHGRVEQAVTAGKRLALVSLLGL